MKAYAVALLFQGDGKTLLVAGTGIGMTTESVVGAMVARTVQGGITLPYIGSAIHEIGPEFIAEYEQKDLPEVGEAVGSA